MKHIFQKLGIATLLLSATTAVSATERMYGVISAGYADSEFAQYSAGSPAYKLALGHEIHPQWYIEGGFQRIADDEAASANLLDGLEGDALFLSVLGKASSRQGELFYRLGVMRADLTGFRESESECVGCALEAYDDGILGGMVGLGFDWYVGLNTMVRIEVEHVFGEDSFSSNAAYIGFRYNFN
jgi:hypothetical protein